MATAVQTGKRSWTEPSILLVCLLLTGMACLYYGARPLIVVSISAAASMLTDFVAVKIRRQKWDGKDVTALLSGIILGLMMPASVPYEIVGAASILSIIFVKQIFGGKGVHIFNVPAGGFLIASICWRDSVLIYPKAEVLDLASNVSQTLGPSLSKTLSLATSPSEYSVNILLGKFPGPMGATHIIILLVVAVVVVSMRAVSGSSFISGLLTVLFLGWCFPQFGESRSMSLYYEMASGMLVFGLLLLASDTETAPKIGISRLMYGILIGIFTVIFRRFGQVENGIVYAVLLANPIGISLDKLVAAMVKMLHSFKAGNYAQRQIAIRKKAEIVAREAEDLALKTAGLKPLVTVQPKKKRKYSPIQRVVFFFKRFTKYRANAPDIKIISHNGNSDISDISDSDSKNNEENENNAK